MSNLLPGPTALPCGGEPATASFESYAAREADVGGLVVRRALPNKQRRLVGAWCFLDHFGPLYFESGKPLDVAPHPHIGLQTVTWLINGEVLHKDSQDNEQLIIPGQLNLMTAGKGISHSEETPIRHSSTLHGVQLWVALPENHRNTDPTFQHHSELPRINFGPASATVLIGELAGARSPATAFSSLVGAEFATERSAELEIPVNVQFEYAIFPIEGSTSLHGSSLQPDVFYYLGTRRDTLHFSLSGKTRFLLLGGEPFSEKILIWWNFVARTNEDMVEARNDWVQGSRFGTVTRYSGSRTPAPPLRVRLKG